MEFANIQTVRRYFDGCNSGIVDDFMRTLATDAVHYFLPERFPPIRGAELLARFWRKFKQVANTVWSTDQIIGQYDRVTSQWSLIWTTAGGSTRLMMRGSEWYVMRSGVITEVRAYFAYDETQDAELKDFAYEPRGYVMR